MLRVQGDCPKISDAVTNLVACGPQPAAAENPCHTSFRTASATTTHPRCSCAPACAGSSSSRNVAVVPKHTSNELSWCYAWGCLYSTTTLSCSYRKSTTNTILHANCVPAPILPAESGLIFPSHSSVGTATPGQLSHATIPLRDAIPPAAASMDRGTPVQSPLYGIHFISGYRRFSTTAVHYPSPLRSAYVSSIVFLQ